MNNEYLNKQRAERLCALIGKYVVIADNSKDPSSVLFYQDPSLVKPSETRVSSWTRFLVNAKGYETKEQAEEKAANFKYGRPRVMCIC